MLGALSAVALVLGSGSPVAGLSSSARNLGAGALVATVVSAIAVSPIGRLSGAHLNPAVTLAFRALGMVSRHDVAGYLAAQLAGWLAGSLTGTSLNPARSAGPAMGFRDLADLWLYAVAPPAGAVAVGMGWSRATRLRRPMTAKLFHDPRYPCSLATTLPAR